jgi:hypothetical protein
VLPVCSRSLCIRSFGMPFSSVTVSIIAVV